MCKFSNKLFTISILLLISTHYTRATPLGLLFDYIDEDHFDDGNKGDYDLRYDQRQNGTENVRLNIDGVLIAIPTSATSQAGGSLGDLATNYLLETLLGREYDDKAADETKPIAAEVDEKEIDNISAEADDNKKVTDLKDVSIDGKKGVAEVVLLRNNAKVGAATDDDEVPNKIHLRRRNK